MYWWIFLSLEQIKNMWRFWTPPKNWHLGRFTVLTQYSWRLVQMIFLILAIFMWATTKDKDSIQWIIYFLNREFQCWAHRLNNRLMSIPYRNQTTNNLYNICFVGHGSIVPQDNVVFQWFFFNQWFKTWYVWCFLSKGNAYERDSYLKNRLWFTPLKLKMVYLNKTPLPLHRSKEMNHLWASILVSSFCLQVALWKAINSWTSRIHIIKTSENIKPSNSCLCSRS